MQNTAHSQPYSFYFALEKIHKTRGLIIRCLDCFIDFLGIHLTYRENDRREKSPRILVIFGGGVQGLFLRAISLKNAEKSPGDEVALEEKR